MRRIFVLALAALALLGVVTPDAFAQAPTPTFKINGLIDQMTTYARNTSNYDGDLARNDKQSGMAGPAAASTSSAKSARPRASSASRWT